MDLASSALTSQSETLPIGIEHIKTKPLVGYLEKEMIERLQIDESLHVY